MKARGTNMIVGFRIKMPSNDYMESEKFINYYSTLFRNCEIKVTKEFNSKEYTIKILNLTRELFDNFVSFHLSKNILTGDNEIKTSDKILISTLEDLNIKTLLITHFPVCLQLNSINLYVRRANSLLKKTSSTILFENCTCEDYKTYLSSFDIFIEKLKSNNLKDFGTCIDFGHLFYCFNKCNISQSSAIMYLEKFSNIIDSVKEIHIHDFNNQKDHLTIGNGMIGLELIHYFLAKNNINCPIIIETNVNIPEEDGLNQVMACKRKLVDTNE